MQGLVNQRTLFRSFSIFLLFALGCEDGDIRGSSELSKDGKTYLAVMEADGFSCPAVYVDGKVWPHKIGALGSIEPGYHRIRCGEDEGLDIGVEIKPGVVYRFDYWGP